MQANFSLRFKMLLVFGAVFLLMVLCVLVKFSLFAVLPSVAAFVWLAWYFVINLCDRVRQFVLAAKAASASVLKESVQNSIGSTNVVAASTETAASLEETSSSVANLDNIAKKNAITAKEVGDFSSQARFIAESGATEVAMLVEIMKDMAVTNKQIEEISAVIDGIAFQTNLLALNAAVEAARAGEHGKGFAVVADSVRSLARKSSAAANQISALIEDMVSKVEQAVVVAGKSGIILNNIVENSAKVTELIQTISNSSLEQAGSINELAATLARLDTVNQANAGHAAGFSSTSENIGVEAEKLDGNISGLIKLIEGSSNDFKVGSTILHARKFFVRKSAENKPLEKLVKRAEKLVKPAEKLVKPAEKLLKPKITSSREDKTSVAVNVKDASKNSSPKRDVIRTVGNQTVDPEQIIPFESDEIGESNAKNISIGNLNDF